MASKTPLQNSIFHGLSHSLTLLPARNKTPQESLRIFRVVERFFGIGKQFTIKCSCAYQPQMISNMEVFD
jgi:hypothetical protein